MLPAALNGLLKEVMPDNLLVDANASLQTTKEGFRIFGPLIGVALFAWTGGWIVALLDAATFAVAAVIIATHPAATRLGPGVTRATSCTRYTSGLRALVADRVLANVLVGVGACLLVLGFTESSIYALLDAFEKPATFAGVFVTIQGLGAVTGGLLATRLVRRTNEVTACVLALGVMAVSMLGIAVCPEHRGPAGLCGRDGPVLGPARWCPS